jgi:hypothetical protein
MKFGFFLSVLLFVNGFSSVANAAYDKSLEELFAVTKIAESTNEMIHSMVDSNIKQNPALEGARAKIEKFYMDTIGWNSIKNDIGAIYKKNFSEAEVTEITKFYKTPAGAKAIQLMPRLFQEGMMISQKRLQERLPELRKIVDAELAKHKK